MSHSIRVENPGNDNNHERPFKNDVLSPIIHRKTCALKRNRNGKMFSEISKIQDYMNIQKLSVIIKGQWFRTMTNHERSRIKGYFFGERIELL